MHRICFRKTWNMLADSDGGAVVHESFLSDPAKSGDLSCCCVVGLVTTSLERFRFVNIPVTDPISRLRREMAVRIGAPDIVFMRDTLYGGPGDRELIIDPINDKLTWREWGASQSAMVVLYCLTLAEYFEMLNTLNWPPSRSPSAPTKATGASRA